MQLLYQFGLSGPSFPLQERHFFAAVPPTSEQPAGTLGTACNWQGDQKSRSSRSKPFGSCQYSYRPRRHVAAGTLHTLEACDSSGWYARTLFFVLNKSASIMTFNCSGVAVTRNIGSFLVFFRSSEDDDQQAKDRERAHNLVNVLISCRHWNERSGGCDDCFWVGHRWRVLQLDPPTDGQEDW